MISPNTGIKFNTGSNVTVLDQKTGLLMPFINESLSYKFYRKHGNTVDPRAYELEWALHKSHYPSRDLKERLNSFYKLFHTIDDRNEWGLRIRDVSRITTDCKLLKNGIAIGYKKIRKTCTSHYDPSFKYEFLKIAKPVDRVDTKLCGSGLHLCAWNSVTLAEYGGNLMLCLFHPNDIVVVGEKKFKCSRLLPIKFVEQEFDYSDGTQMAQLTRYSKALLPD